LKEAHEIQIREHGDKKWKQYELWLISHLL
jgi:hypothetical protein